MIKVLHVLSDTNVGGAGIYIATLAKLIDRKKFKLFLACPKGSKIIDIVKNDIEIIEIASQGDKSLEIGTIKQLVKIIKKNKVDIVHTHASLSGRIAAKITGAKIVYTRHTPSESMTQNGLKRVINKYINNFLCDKVIAVSNFVEKQLIEDGISHKKIIKIYNGVNYSEYESLSHLKRENGEGLTLIQVARLEAEKGHKYAIEAISLIDKEKYSVKLIIVGDGSKKGELEELAKGLKVEDRVAFTGYVKVVKGFVEKSDVIILPSINEAFAIALLEGMAAGKPCIASNVGGVPEVAQDGVNGILVEPKNSEAIKDAVVKLYENPELRRSMGEQSIRIVKEKFDSTKLIKHIEQVYAELLS